MYIDNSGKEAATQINQSVMEAYYHQINTLAGNLHLPVPGNWFEVLLRLPDALKTETSELDENEWIEIKKTLKDALAQLQEFRIREGKTLDQLFRTKIGNIEALLEQIAPFEAERLDKIKARLEDNLKTLSEKIDYDKNRLEQELIFYIEKLDVNEEKLRLATHLKYFIETMEHQLPRHQT